ncbi:probable leucine-rich repeat receptor-like protein kinase At5g49770 [Oryza glaberrima]|uniref:probable leucine-rich repeat receptor-like protein kinase At5g49770 n=1 Tax=Oryza glaberrima TaxID=4538 RepID=UPI00224C2C74|nr:probable leucine-rich repeat receptor-like protein kinase At5g49770 [Oryza glaberrima]
MALPTVVVAGIAAAVATLLVAAAVAAAWWWRVARRSRRNSDTGSSETPPTLVEWGRCGRTLSAPEYQGARQFSLEELAHATKNFSDANLVGAGSFGPVYKGLLLDGTVVAVKRRVASPRQDFVDEVKRLSEIWHRNVVTLIGYCQEGGLQMLVFEYLPNGSVCGHLYDTGKESMTRLEFKQRLSIAIGAAKGLNHLHSLVPPLIHKGFKTSNVLVDENFIAKVADAGIDRLLRGFDGAAPSHHPSSSCSSIYQDPEVHSLAQLSESSDVYSFGVFLLELITGKEAASLISSEPREPLVHWMESHFSSNNEVTDPRLGGSFTSEGMKELVGLTWQCVSTSARRRPKMRLIAAELDRILEKEMSLTTVMGDGTAIVTLGSQLFTS